MKSALSDASKREAARKEALAKIAELKAQYAKTSTGLKAELAQKTAELRRKSEELMKLAGQSAHRAAEIIRSEEHHPAEAEEAGAEKSSYHHEEHRAPEHSGAGATHEIDDVEAQDHEDDEGPEQEHR